MYLQELHSEYHSDNNNNNKSYYNQVHGAAQNQVHGAAQSPYIQPTGPLNGTYTTPHQTGPYPVPPYDGE